MKPENLMHPSALSSAIISLYGRMLWLYPRRFRAEFRLEMQGVFGQACMQAAENGRSVLLLFWRELKDLPLAALKEHLRGRKENLMRTNEISKEPATPWWALVGVVLLFVIPGIMLNIHFIPQGISQIVGYTLAAIFAVFVIGGILLALFNRLPRWSLVYFGIITGFIGFYVIFTGLSLVFEDQILNLMNHVVNRNDLVSRIFGQWINQGQFWLGILLANLLFMALMAALPWFRPQVKRFRDDLTLLSFLFYGGILLVYFIDFDEYRYDELYQLACLTSLGVGAWGYLRAITPGKRTLALLAGLTGCMLIMGVGKYFLVPQQDWPYWLSLHPAASERWFESLRTIATWFWCALAVGLPGLIQTLRKSPPVMPQDIPQAA